MWVEEAVVSRLQHGASTVPHTHSLSDREADILCG